MTPGIHHARPTGPREPRDAATLAEGQRLTTRPEFLKYWTAQAIGELAAHLTALALSLTAVVTLSASASEMGVLAAARNLPYLGAALMAGVLVDRRRRQPIIVRAGLASALLLLLVPIAAFTGRLRIEILYAVSFGVGAMSTTMAVASRALLPVLIGRPHLVEANSLLQMSLSAVQMGGPGVGGFLIQLVTAPFALLGSAAGSIASAVLVARLRVAEPPPLSAGADRSALREIREGLHLVMADKVLRPIVLTGATHNFFSNGMLTAIYVLFASSALGLTPAQIGLVLAAGAPGTIAGAALAAPLARALGLGQTLGSVQVITGVARLAVPLAAFVGSPFGILVAGELLLGLARPIFNVHQLSLRQALVPDQQMGRTTATIGVIMWGAVPIGALLGGWLGSVVGLVPTLAIAVAGTFGAALNIYLSPVRDLRLTPAAAAS